MAKTETVTTRVWDPVEHLRTEVMWPPTAGLAGRRRHRPDHGGARRHRPCPWHVGGSPRRWAWPREPLQGALQGRAIEFATVLKVVQALGLKLTATTA